MSEFLNHFGINWKLLLAQAVNFFILLFILQRFAYGPLLRMLKKRKENIAKGVVFSRSAEERLAGIEKERQGVLTQAKTEALSIVTSAEDVARKRKDEIMAESQKKVEGIVADAKRFIEEEKGKMKDGVLKNAEELVRLGIVKVLGRMAPKDRDDTLIHSALEELRTLK